MMYGIEVTDRKTGETGLWEAWPGDTLDSVRIVHDRCATTHAAYRTYRIMQRATTNDPWVSIPRYAET